MQSLFVLAILLPNPAAWPMEELTLSNGTKLPGLVLQESEAGVRFRIVRRLTGRPTVTLTTFYPTPEVKLVTHLKDPERKVLREKLEELDAANDEQKRAEELKLSPVTWLNSKTPALKFESESFTLISSGTDEVTRRVAVRLEQIMLAYNRHFPPRAKSKPTTIYLAMDPDDYREAALAVLKPKNPTNNYPKLGFFDVSSNSVVCSSEMKQVGLDLAAARLSHVQQIAEITHYEASINALYKNAPRLERERHLQTAATERAKIQAAERRNDFAFNESTKHTFARLYHEAFHAYIGTRVYRALSRDSVNAGKGTGALPRWMNEGLAQIFETAILDGYELRVGHADKTRLDALHKGLKNLPGGITLLPLNDLLRAGFGNDHSISGTQTSRAYHTAWAVAFHLAFERRLLGSSAFNDYLKAINTGTSARDAFENLIGKRLEEYETELNEYLLKLQPDGSVKK